jgi:subtilase family serine protease
MLRVSIRSLLSRSQSTVVCSAVLLLLVVSTTLVDCAPATQPELVQFGEQVAPTHKLYGWSPVNAHPTWLRQLSMAPVHAVFALRQRNTAQLSETLRAVSDPRSARYGQYLSFAQLGELISPSPAALNSVLSFLHAHHIEDHEIHVNGWYMVCLLF